MTVVVPSAHAITDSVTPCGATSFLVFTTLTTTAVTFSLGKSCVDNNVGEPRTGAVGLPDLVVKMTSISITFLENTLMPRTIIPCFVKVK